MATDNDLLLKALAEAPDGLTRPELLRVLRQQRPYIGPADVERVIKAAGGLVRIHEGRIFSAVASSKENLAGKERPLLRRLIAFDVESIVRPIIKEPYREQHIFQIGAVRFGPDKKWTDERREFSSFTELPSLDDERLIYTDELRNRYHAEKRPLAEVLEGLRDFCSEAEVVVAYNGVAHDFRLIEEEYRRCELSPLLSGPKAPRLVDALYLALALWPIPPRQHRLKDLLERLEISVDDMQWHDALDDSKMVVELLEHGAREVVPSLGTGITNLLAAAGSGSDAWELIFALLGGLPECSVHDQATVDSLLLLNLESKTTKKPLRPEPSSDVNESSAAQSGPLDIAIPPQICDERGRVSLDHLVRSVKGEGSEARASQREMVMQMREWLKEERPALIEAPTGTGKSYAILTVALDWLAADRNNKVVISTFTKQLQAQLAADIEALTAVIPELASTADMVKGSANRLSLRALVIALTELTEPDTRKHRRGRQDFSHDQRYRDLVIYLMLRFIASGKPVEEWEARSVDRVDVPQFFDEYCHQRLSLYLATLSQAESNDYGRDRGGIGRYTLTVREALEMHRLIIANHALLLAHLDDFSKFRAQTLLIVDEAHELENAATTALSRELDFGALAELATQVAEMAKDQSRFVGAEQLADACANLDRYLDDERLVRAAMRAFDTAEHDLVGQGALRTVTIASPLQGDAFVQPMEHLAAELRTCRRVVGLISAAFRGIAQPTDPYELDRFHALWSRTAEIDRALSGIVNDVDAVLAPARGDAPEGASAASAMDAEAEAMAKTSEKTDQLQFQLVDGGTTAASDTGERLVIVDAEGEAPAAEADEEPTPIELASLPAPRSNRVVFADELEIFHPGRAGDYYRFRITSSPIELGRENAWKDFKRSFARLYFVSATLRVAGAWDFVRRRLDLPEESAGAINLASPFDAAKQAELVCFEDFPSWAEHSAAAIHTLAHQVDGYAAEVIDDHGYNGAMVLTTSRASAAGIFDWLARLRVERGRAYPLISAGIEGNLRAIETFKKVGGALVGTRGLWQGVDISDARRLRIVWINKLPFAPFNNPVIAARLALERELAHLRGVEDPEAFANEHYYLPLAALSLRQAVGRLIRSLDHRGVVIISDRKLSGPTRLRRLYRRVFLGSLDPGFMKVDHETGEAWLGNVRTMRDGWKRIFAFLARANILTAARASELSSDDRLQAFTELPETLEILKRELSVGEESKLRESGLLPDEIVRRGAEVAGFLKATNAPIRLRPQQDEALRAIAKGKDLLAVLPTGYGKSFIFQLPALIMSGVTIVVSPLVSLMTDQALELNRTIAGRVRALVAPMRESNSRTGKSEIEEELKGWAKHDIKIIYLSPERLCQHHFQRWILAGVQRGVVRRVVLDEAHIFVQWGDDFRPSVRRAEDFLRRLKRNNRDLQLIAVTATANETVREGLRSAIFGLAPGEEHDKFAFVRANPLRPELAIYRRVLPPQQGGPTSIAGLVERVVDTLNGHAIFYCLTVRQVEALYAHLCDYLQGHPVQVLMYHGRLTDAEKTGVANAFRSAPQRGEEGYRRMVVIATSALGLGIDRPDIRTVFCVSPPTDLAALYQQLGRAGRDRAATPAGGGQYTAGLTIIYPRAQRTISFMTQQQVARDLLARIAGKLLALEGSVFSAKSLARDLIDEDLRAGRVQSEEAAKSETLDKYHTAVLSVLAELSLQGTITDLGDFPRTVQVLRGEYKPDTDAWRVLVDSILAQLPPKGVIETTELHKSLPPQFREEYPDPGSLFHGLLELHTLGYLDVSQRPNREQLTGIKLHSRKLDDGTIHHLEQRRRRMAKEVQWLRSWFDAAGECCNEGLRRYFDAKELPLGTCASDDCRCSVCWNKPDVATAMEPKLYEAFRSDSLRPASATTKGRKRSEEQLDRLVWHILWHNYAGLVENIIWAVLRGEDHYFSRAERKRKPLWPRLLLSRARGRKPALRRAELQESLQRLVAAGQVNQTGARYRLACYVLKDQSRAAATEGGSGNAPQTPQIELPHVAGGQGANRT